MKQAKNSSRCDRHLLDNLRDGGQSVIANIQLCQSACVIENGRAELCQLVVLKLKYVKIFYALTSSDFPISRRQNCLIRYESVSDPFQNNIKSSDVTTTVSFCRRVITLMNTRHL